MHPIKYNTVQFLKNSNMDLKWGPGEIGTGPHSQVGALTEASPYEGGRTNKSPHMQAHALTHSDTTRSLHISPLHREREIIVLRNQLWAYYFENNALSNHDKLFHLTTPGCISIWKIYSRCHTLLDHHCN